MLRFRTFTVQILTNDRMESAVTGNVFNEVDFCICRLDKLARNEQLQEKLKVSEDIFQIICILDSFTEQNREKAISALKSISL